MRGIDCNRKSSRNGRGAGLQICNCDARNGADYPTRQIASVKHNRKAGPLAGIRRRDAGNNRTDACSVHLEQRRVACAVGRGYRDVAKSGASCTTNYEVRSDLICRRQHAAECDAGDGINRRAAQIRSNDRNRYRGSRHAAGWRYGEQ